jgi:hypothetical protein
MLDAKAVHEGLNSGFHSEIWLIQDDLTLVCQDTHVDLLAA